MQPALCFRSASTLVGRCGVVVALIASLGALYGLNVASDPETYMPEPTALIAAEVHGEQHYRNVADPSHNLRIFALREALADRGFLLDGDRELSADPLAAIRGTYGLHAPDVDSETIEWRLMATRARSCQPTSMLRLHDQTEFSPHLVEALLAEWKFGELVLPAEVVAAGEKLLAELVQRRAECQPGNHCLEERTSAGDYELIAELNERHGQDGNSPTCEIALLFTWVR
jgi:hypothetical protein